jgi:hypothetical protein
MIVARTIVLLRPFMILSLALGNRQLWVLTQHGQIKNGVTYPTLFHRFRCENATLLLRCLHAKIKGSLGNESQLHKDIAECPNATASSTKRCDS